MSKEEPPVERLVADIPVELKRKIAAAAALRGIHLKDLVIQIFEEWLAEQDWEQLKAT